MRRHHTKYHHHHHPSNIPLTNSLKFTIYLLCTYFVVCVCVQYNHLSIYLSIHLFIYSCVGVVGGCDEMGLSAGFIEKLFVYSGGSLCALLISNDFVTSTLCAVRIQNVVLLCVRMIIIIMQYKKMDLHTSFSHHQHVFQISLEIVQKPYHPLPHALLRSHPKTKKKQ